MTITEYDLSKQRENREARMSELENFMAERQRRSDIAYKKLLGEEEARKRYNEENWVSPLTTGISLGSLGGPYGAAIGGVLGAAYGLGRAGKSKLVHGASPITALDPKYLFAPENLQGEVSAASAISRLQSQQKDAANAQLFPSVAAYKAKEQTSSAPTPPPVYGYGNESLTGGLPPPLPPGSETSNGSVGGPPPGISWETWSGLSDTEKERILSSMGKFSWDI